MDQVNCNCPVCKGSDYNAAGIQLAEQEIIPFFKNELLKLKYPTHPFPLKYDGLLASIMCFSQALAHNRSHKVGGAYYTENKWLLKYRTSLMYRFGMAIFHKSELKHTANLVCEFNVEH